mmetsp:Transcript_110793/g.320191  ORF Transcript_110793/g.320191 Transcript_110793/m.320191 type:complete len:374 (+) Transcript_110793:84-1205(+)
MFLNKNVVALWALSVGGASAFSTSTKSVAFVARSASGAVSRTHSAGCTCPSCVSLHPAGCQCGACSNTHSSSCMCASCRSGTALFADVAEEVPAEVEAMDGVESSEEAHNVDRPARSSLKKKRAPKGKDLAEFEVDSMVKGTVRTITSYGAFVDIGASTDGLLHISQLSSEYVGDVTEMLAVGQEVDVRIVSVDSDKGQVALSLMTVQEAEESAAAAKQKRENSRPQRPPRRDDSAILSQLKEKGWDEATFVDGKVVSTVDFGCFVRIDASQLNEEIEGEFDGLVHISAMATNRVASVTDVVKPEDDIKVRVKTITGNKVGLTMLSVEDEEYKQDSQPTTAPEGAKDWKESYEKFDNANPVFKNGPVVVDLRK